jgi:hypothetical protein
MYVQLERQTHPQMFILLAPQTFEGMDKIIVDVLQILLD